MKIIKIIIALVIISLISYFSYLYFVKIHNRNAFSVVPNDAIFIIETSNLNKGWEAISKSKIWNHLKTNSYFSEINKSAAKIDSLMKYNKTADLLLSGRQLLISAHMKSESDYDFLFIVDVQKASKLSYITQLFNLFDYKVTKHDYQGVEITELYSNKNKDTLSICFIDNLLLGSYTSDIVKKAIEQKKNNYWKENIKFQDAISDLDNKLFKFYFNYQLLDKYMKCYLSDESELVSSLSKQLMFSALDVNLENEVLSFDGFSNYNDSVPSFYKALLKSEPGKMDAYKILSDQTALYISLCFDNFTEFYDNLQKEYSAINSADYNNITNNIKTLEKFLNVSLKEDFFNWIGNEIAFVKLKPSNNSTEDDVVIAINSNDIDKTKSGLSDLMKQVRKRTPMKFEAYNYNNYEIDYLKIKGFFKLLFGKLFGKLEKPYFTYIDNYIVFSNSPSILMDIIDDYSKNKTLANDSTFIEFKKQFKDESNISVFVNTPKLYQNIYLYSNNENKKNIKNNKDLILSFNPIGLQLITKNYVFSTTLITEHDEFACFDESLESFESAAEELYLNEFDSLKFKYILTGNIEDGEYKDYYPDKSTGSNRILKVGGLISDKLQTGLWKTYYPSGNQKSAIVYKEGKAVGIATFYYDDLNKERKIEATFNDDILTDDYYEYYKNGQTKVKLNFTDGKLDGDALFYYDSGKLKIEGQYSKGVKTGKCKYYTETGELFNKEKFKKDF